MAFSVIGQVGASSTTGNNVTTGSLNTTGADLLIVAVGSYQGVANTLSDTVGGNSNTWNGLTLKAQTGDSQIRLFWSVPTHVGSGHTFTVSSTGAYPSLCAIAVSGGKQTTPFDQENGAVSSSFQASLATGSITPTEDNELVVTAAGWSTGRTWTQPTGYTYAGTANVDYQNYGSGTNFGTVLAYQIQTTAAATNPTWTPNASSLMDAVVASFKIAPVATANGRFLGFFM